MFEKVLIANRGEIAVRVIRACREMGIRTVAVHSECDARAPFVGLADEAVALGADPPLESYLDVGKILKAATDTRAQAIHPGYGFLSENPQLARACVEAGIVFVGPTADVMEVMGDKIRARELMKQAGVPVVPSVTGEDPLAVARQIGFPVLVKAAAGGGGKGMRRVEDEASFAPALEGAQREARSAFGDERVFIEKYVERPRHIEVQILADHHGEVVHLQERDCSLQRRHQKVVEEAPSPVLGEAEREALTSAAVTAARAVGYRGAGTVEFIRSPEGEFYFLEMNTRLQVEHPVTEMVLGVDLVNWQLRIARGENLDPELARRRVSGHAIECRLYAEDPWNNFAPSVGTLQAVTLPEGPGIRIDGGFGEGDAISPHYDPMILKLICWGPDRDHAIERTARALRDTRILGIRTNLEFLIAIVESEAFRDGAVDTGLLEREPPELHRPDEDDIRLALAAHTLASHAPRTGSSGTEGTATIPDPWTTIGAKRFP